MSDYEAVGVFKAVEELNGDGLGEDYDCSVHVHGGLVVAVAGGDVLTGQVGSLGDDSSQDAVLGIVGPVEEDVPFEVVVVNHFRDEQEQVGEGNDGVFACDCEVVYLLQQVGIEELKVGTGDLLVGLEELRDHRLVFRN